MTYDNGIEFSDHEVIEKRTGMTIYFAHPYHSWERGTNENMNGLYRQFFPKKHDFTHVSQKEIDRVTRLLNTRPRKRHHYQTPDEIFRSQK
jgi:IS30 family transposase